MNLEPGYDWVGDGWPGMEEDEEPDEDDDDDHDSEAENDRRRRDKDDDDDVEHSRRNYAIIFEALSDIARHRRSEDRHPIFKALEIKSDVGEMSLSDTPTDPTNQLAALSEGCLNR